MTAPTVKPFYFDLSPDERDETLRLIREVLESGNLVLGPKVEAFEAEFARTIGVRHAIGVSSGTAALEMILRIKGVEGAAVAVPTNTNFATVAAVLHAGGRPVFLDMSRDTFMPSLSMLAEAHEREGLAGAVWVHIGGLISPDFAECVSFCREHGLFMIEDAAHAHGSRVSGGAAGSLADAGAFSFFATKVMTTLEGGMITTDDDELASLARSFRNQGKRGAAFGNDHLDLGNSCRLTEMAAAVGLVQLRKLDAMALHRQRACEYVCKRLEALDIGWCRFDHMERFSGYKLIVRTPEDHALSVSGIKDAMRERGVHPGGGVYDKPCHLQPVFAHLESPPGGLPVAEKWCPRHICPPVTSGTTPEDLNAITDALDVFLPSGRVGR